ncbi:MAG: rod shape-determining protein MreC [Bacteroidales bacterium]|nr:rod shape-determining protein MreC [Bacteroidales bacterium]
MRNLLRFIIQHHFLILFLIIESFSLFLLFNANPYHRVRFYSSSHKVSGRISNKMENIKDYFSLYNENQKLSEENARLYNRLKSSYRLVAADTIFEGDSLSQRKFMYLTARVINNTVNKQYNYITLDRGSAGGIEPEMAVISSDGIVGIVKTVTPNYAAVLSLLNRDFIISAKIKKNGYFGPLSWNGNSTEYATLVDIPHHVQVNEGDTIVTSGFGGVFPEGFMIGTIDHFRLKGGNYYEITVNLSSDFRKLSYVQVIRNYARQEIDSIEYSVNQ